MVRSSDSSCLGPESLFPVFRGQPEGPPPEEVSRVRQQFCGRGEALLWLRGDRTKNCVFLFFCLKWHVFKHAFSVMNSSSAFGTKGETFPERVLEHTVRTNKITKPLLSLMPLQTDLLLK